MSIVRGFSGFNQLVVDRSAAFHLKCIHSEKRLAFLTLTKLVLVPYITPVLKIKIRAATGDSKTCRSLK